MPKSSNNVASRARKKKVFKQTKGYYGRRKNVLTVAKNALDKAGVYAYRDRKAKKRYFRRLWITRINAGLRELGLTYSKFIGVFNKSGIQLNRKVLADLAYNDPSAFISVVDQVKK